MNKDEYIIKHIMRTTALNRFLSVFSYFIIIIIIIIIIISSSSSSSSSILDYVKRQHVKVKI